MESIAWDSLTVETRENLASIVFDCLPETEQ
jgi:hypothetical protein